MTEGIGIARVLVVGASVAGVAAVDALLSRTEVVQVTVVDSQPELPYDRPPLSKQVLAGTMSPDDIVLRPPEFWTSDRVRLLRGVSAVSISNDSRMVTLSDTTNVEFDAAIIATGCRARKLPQLAGRHNVCTLRTIEEARRIREALRPGAAIVIVGGGFIGLEVAAAAVSRGAQVTIVEAEAVPLARVVGEPAAFCLMRRHRAEGVSFRTGVTVVGAKGRPIVASLQLSDDTTVSCDFVVVGIGVVPETDWLAGSPVRVSDGILCDEFLRSAAPRVFAAGDVASWNNPTFGRRMRVEHWTTAMMQGRAASANVAADLTGAPPMPFTHLPYVWSDQYDLKIQIVGLPSEGDTIETDGLESGRPLMMYRRGGRLVGAMGINRQGDVMKLRRQLWQAGPGEASKKSSPEEGAWQADESPQ